MQAIHTRIIPATNTRATRIFAECSRGSIMIQSALCNESHQEAADYLRRKFIEEDFVQLQQPKDENPWSLPFISGELKDGSMVHVFFL